MRWRSFVALGDSFTEGLDDPYPHGGYRGWADLVALRLAELAPTLTYANLAIRGRRFDAIVAEQVPRALAMRPDLVSFAGGGNDALRLRFDVDAIAARLDEVVGAFRAIGADVVLFRWADVTRLPARRLILSRSRLINQAVSEVADRHGAILVNLWDDAGFGSPSLWSDDRLHLSPAGHQRVAAHVLAALGVAPEESWLADPQPPPRRGWWRARVHDARWAGRHLVPWIARRLTGRSSGDKVLAKRPTLTPVID